MADAAKLPAERRMTCQDDYLNASWSWQQVLQSHLRKPDQPKTAINVVYGPGTGEHEAYAAVVQQMNILETMADDTGRPLRLARADLARNANLRGARMRASSFGPRR